MKSKQIFLSPSAGKQLIALALAQDASVVEAMEKHTVLVVAGTTNAYLAQALLARIGDTDFEKYRFFRGIIRREGIPESLGKLEGDVVISKGQRIRGKTIHDLADGMRAGDIIFKGANAVHLATGQSAILAGNPTSGTMGPIYRAAVGRRVRVIVPVGVEKRVEQPIHQLCQIVNSAEAIGLRLAPSVGMAYTELDAIRALTGTQPYLVAGGGVCGCEGAAFFQCQGTNEQLEKLDYWLHQVSSTPRFSFANCK
ncbi:MAG: hypothetical protein IJD39_04855 [Clostridia bacterium]|nr:hypothetical protein [Clostridia bacterium]